MNCEQCGTELSCRVCAKGEGKGLAAEIKIHHRQAAAHLINSQQCGCGGAKFIGAVCCNTCWAKLPRELQGALPKMYRSEFVVTLAAAQAMLGYKTTVLDAKPKAKKEPAIPSSVQVPE